MGEQEGLVHRYLRYFSVCQLEAVNVSRIDSEGTGIAARNMDNSIKSFFELR